MLRFLFLFLFCLTAHGVDGGGSLGGAAGGGSGDVVGPASAVDGNFACYNGATGKIIEDCLKAPPTGDVVGTSDAQSLTNKTLDGDLNTVSNLAHGAEVDNPSSGVHGVTGSVVGTTDSQTLTNKTIAAGSNTVTSTASRAAEFNGSGNLTASTITAAELGHLSGATANIQTGKLDVDGDGLVDGFFWQIEIPENKSYWVHSTSFPYTVDAVVAQCDSGTATVALENNAGTALTGCSAMSFSSVESSDTCTANNTFVAGDNLEIVFSSVSSADDCRFSIKYTRD